MITKVHHLNCGTMCPFCKRLINNRDGSWSEPGKLVCHCLLIETSNSLILVDSGVGTRDIAASQQRLGKTFLSVFKPRLSLEETALHQIRALGYDPRDVRHIIPTHLDLDHAGGLADFPEAKVHVLRPELQQILQPTWRDKLRFSTTQFDHNPDWQVHEHIYDNWFDFQAIRPVPGVSADIFMIPLIGHTKGHVGVAVKLGNKWLLHCGDAYYHHSQVTASPEVPVGIKVMEKAFETFKQQRLENVAKLRDLALKRRYEVELFCAHDAVELSRYNANAVS